VALIRKEEPHMLPDLIRYLVDAVHDADGKAGADGLLSVPYKAYFILLKAQELNSPVLPLVEEFLRMDYDKGRLSALCNDMKSHNGLPGPGWCAENPEVPGQHRFNGLLLEGPQLSLEGKVNLRQYPPLVLQVVPDTMTPAKPYELPGVTPGDDQAVPRVLVAS